MSVMTETSHTAHKKFTTGFGCRGYDPYDEVFSTGHCQETHVYKSAKYVLF